MHWFLTFFDVASEIINFIYSDYNFLMPGKIAGITHKDFSLSFLKPMKYW